MRPLRSFGWLRFDIFISKTTDGEVGVRETPRRTVSETTGAQKWMHLANLKLL